MEKDGGEVYCQGGVERVSGGVLTQVGAGILSDVDMRLRNDQC